MSGSNKTASQNVVRTFRSAPRGRPDGLHYIWFGNALSALLSKKGTQT